LEARGDYLYIADYYGSIKIYDISVREAPILLYTITGVGSAYGLKLSDDYLYVSCAGSGLKIYNISNPETPFYVSSLNTGAGGHPLLTKDGDYVYLANYSGTHKIINVSNPANPALVSTINIGGFTHQLSYANQRLFTGNFSSGIYMHDVSNPNAPSLLGSASPFYAGTFAVHIAGPTLYVADLGCLRDMSYASVGDGYYHKQAEPFEWYEISETGDAWDMLDDSFTQPIPIPFSFPFYDRQYEALYVCSNGFIAFNNYSPSHWDTPIPCDTQPNNIIAPFWDRFSTEGCPDNVFTQYFEGDPGFFVVEFKEIPHFGTTEFETFEALLYENGDIKFMYPEVTNAASATVGIENETGTRGTMWTHNPMRPVAEQTGLGIRRINPDNPGLGFEGDWDGLAAIPKTTVLSVFPNPFNPETSIQFSLLNSGNVRLAVYDINGRMVDELFNGYSLTGIHSFKFNGAGLASGIYFARLQAGGTVSTQKLLLVK